MVANDTALAYWYQSAYWLCDGCMLEMLASTSILINNGLNISKWHQKQPFNVIAFFYFNAQVSKIRRLAWPTVKTPLNRESLHDLLFFSRMVSGAFSCLRISALHFFRKLLGLLSQSFLNRCYHATQINSSFTDTLDRFVLSITSQELSTACWLAFVTVVSQLVRCLPAGFLTKRPRNPFLSRETTVICAFMRGIFNFQNHFWMASSTLTPVYWPSVKLLLVFFFCAFV